MKTKFVTIFFIFVILQISRSAFAEGFTANWVDIYRLKNGTYRVIVKYTNLSIGQYRESFADFKTKKEAVDVFEKLALGATFYLGSSQKIFFFKEPDKLTPY